MDFDLTEEQRLLSDSVDRLLADTYTFEKRRGYLAEPEGWSRAVWSQYAELGLLGLPFAEEHGGFGGGGKEKMLGLEALGRGSGPAASGRSCSCRRWAGGWPWSRIWRVSSYRERRCGSPATRRSNRRCCR